MSDKYFDLISSAGFTAVRIPIEFSSHSLSADPYTIDPSFMKTVDWVVKTSNDYGLVAIIDMHNYWDLMSDPNNQSERFLTLWKQISEHYQSYPNGQVYFELLNEPNGNLDSAKWNKLLAKAIMIVRQTNPVRPIIIDGEADWDPSGSLGGLRLPDDPNLIVTFHYYKPKEFTHQGADWISGAHSWLGTTWDGTPQETAVIASDFNWVANWAKNNNRPIFMGEFGALSTASQASRVRWTTAMRIAAEQRDFSWGYWDFCTRMPGFGVYDIDAQVWLNDLLQALIPNP
jgi:endoglucanase